ncbi:hypothetical protein [Nonomuraea indica]|uniref:hypothetical protein n=1 Tax=Nonomuraea indica TaxID=1581193 RepID=UPI00118438E8|nr:hypothetical protein [Nonomuraea indica]
MWHYTCGHGAAGIQRDGMVKPHLHPLLGVPVAWFTDLGPAHRLELGLTSDRLSCDRMEHRFTVADVGPLQWWPKAARLLRLSRPVRTELEQGRLPAHWWVSFDPVPVLVAEAREAS